MSENSLESRVSVIEAVLEERQETMNLTADNLKERLHLLNELRGDVMTRTEYTRAHELLESKIAVVNKLAVSLLIALVMSLGGALLALLHH